MNITKTLDLKQNIISTTTILPGIIEAFKDHPSINPFSAWCPLKSHK